MECGKSRSMWEARTRPHEGSWLAIMLGGRWRLSRGCRRVTAWVSVLMGLCVSPIARADAQVVRGHVTDSLAARPVSAAIVVLVDSTDRERARALTDATGRFVVKADEPGRYRLRTLVIGYRRWESNFIALARGQSVERRVTLGLVPVALPVLTVEAERTCSVRPGAGLAAAALWEEVRKALEVTQLTLDRRRYRFATVVHTKEFDRHRALQAESTQRNSDYTAFGFGSLDAKELKDWGFVRSSAGGPIYYGPDARLLVSDAFLDGHCFRVRRAGRPGAVGLAFEPVGDQRVPDIEGTLWLDSATVALLGLEWRYTAQPHWARGGDPGGSMEFGQLPNGAWYVRRWTLRAPIARVTLGRADTLLHGTKVREGVVSEVLTAGGDVVVRFDSTGTVPETVRR